MVCARVHSVHYTKSRPLLRHLFQFNEGPVFLPSDVSMLQHYNTIHMLLFAKPTGQMPASPCNLQDSQYSAPENLLLHLLDHLLITIISILVEAPRYGIEA